jgi:hypothetical protein
MLALIILNKNEALSIEKSLLGMPYERFSVVLAIDGNSEDYSVEVFKSLNIEVVHQKSSGRGRALRLGLEIIQRDFPLVTEVILFSTDGNEDANDVNKIINLLPDYDLVIASRMLAQSWNKEDHKSFRPRKLLNKVFAYIGYVLLYSKKLPFISDPLNGLRGFKVDFFNDLNLSSDGYSVEYEMSLKAYLMRSKCCEFPTREGMRLHGSSQVPPIRTIFELVKVLVFVFFKRFRSLTKSS